MINLFLMSQGYLNVKLRFLGKKICYVVRPHTDRHERKKTPFHGFNNYSLNLSSRSGPIGEERFEKEVNGFFSIWLVRIHMFVNTYNEKHSSKGGGFCFNVQVLWESHTKVVGVREDLLGKSWPLFGDLTYMGLLIRGSHLQGFMNIKRKRSITPIYTF